MSEELKQAVDALKNVEIPEYTELEQEQMEEGWIPPERQDQLDGKKFLSAEEYKERGKFFKKIDALKNQVEQQSKTIDQINDHNKKVTAQQLQRQRDEYEQTISTLKNEKVAALDEGDSKRVVEIDEAMQKAHDDQKQPPVQSNAPPPEFTAWQTKNEWYKNDPELKDYADMIGDGYIARNPNATPQQLYAFAEAETKARFPDKFENKQRQAPPSVEGGGTPVTRSKTGKLSAKDLTSEERVILNNFESMKIFKTDADRQDYLKEVISLRD